MPYMYICLFMAAPVYKISYGLLKNHVFLNVLFQPSLQTQPFK